MKQSRKSRGEGRRKEEQERRSLEELGKSQARAAGYRLSGLLTRPPSLSAPATGASPVLEHPTDFFPLGVFPQVWTSQTEQWTLPRVGHVTPQNNPWGNFTRWPITANVISELNTHATMGGKNVSIPGISKIKYKILKTI